MKDKIVNIINEEPFVGQDGLDYIKVTKEILTPRKTYLKGTVSGKYRGDKIPDDDEKSDLYDFEIYEAEVTCNSIDDFSKNKPFVFPNDFKNIDNQKKIKGTVFPKSKLPETLPVIISANNKTFGINVLEPKLYEFSIIRKLHQSEGEQVFGSFNAYITGYVFDYEREEEEEIIGPIVGPPPPLPPRKKCESNGIKTGEFEEKPGYIRYEYFCKHHPDTVWGPWEKDGESEPKDGCFSSIFSVIGLIFGLFFLFAILPSLIYIIPVIIFFFLLNLIAPYLKWIVRILGIILLIGLVSSIINSFHRTSNYVPKPLIVDVPKEQEKPEEMITVDTTSQTSSIDTIIRRYRIWNDYDGNEYEGEYTLLASKISKSTAFKNTLVINSSSSRAYDEILYSLKENDKSNLNGLYKLFDSIGKSNSMNQIKFAEMVTSFVQDMPYVLILENECNPNLYSDRFIKQYLSDPNAKCAPSQRFGINTPLEFLDSIEGDCDTRTLLLYTIFAHYNYDVVILSSEQYGHSILGINLPLNGKSYQYQNQRYFLWETTAPHAKPGVISSEISNLNFWRISLKSK
jgi:hypothetical protein